MRLPSASKGEGGHGGGESDADDQRPVIHARYETHERMVAGEDGVGVVPGWVSLLGGRDHWLMG